MKTILGISLIVFFVLAIPSCSGPIDKSVTEPLTREEILSIAEKHPVFESLYNHEVIQKSGQMQNDFQKERWKNLTYARLLKFQEYLFDIDYQASLRSKITAEWEKKYKQYIPKADSAAAYWTKYLEENALETYASIELLSIDKIYTTPVWGGEPYFSRLEFVLKVVPLRGRIEELDANYDLFEKDEKPHFSSLFSQYNSVGISEPFSSSVIVKKIPTLKNSIEQFVIDSDLEKIRQRYNFAFCVNSLVLEGKKLYSGMIWQDIPRSIAEYMRALRNDQSKEYQIESARTSLIQNCIEKEYVDEATYLNNEKTRIYKEYDALAYEYMFVRPTP